MKGIRETNMFEKVNPSHPDKVADRIAGAIVDLAYRKQDRPKIAVEVLIGHGKCHIISETSVRFGKEEIESIVLRICGETVVDYSENEQDAHLAENQKGHTRCGDNGIFKGAPVTDEQKKLSGIARKLYEKYPYDGKYILDGKKLVICQSNAKTEELREAYPDAVINPLGEWTGGMNVDCGATNRKLGSDMADGVTGGGLHGKDLSKADVSVNIYAHLQAQKQGIPVCYSCAIGDETVNGIPYEEMIGVAEEYIRSVGGFERFAEWGLV